MAAAAAQALSTVAYDPATTDHGASGIKMTPKTIAGNPNDALAVSAQYPKGLHARDGVPLSTLILPYLESVYIPICC